jgi:hypothetical protein
MVVKKPKSEVRWRVGRIGVRMHKDLRSALEFLASEENRPLSNYVETLLLEGVRERLVNPLSAHGERLDDRPWRRRIDDEVIPHRHSPLASLPGLPRNKKR